MVGSYSLPQGQFASLSAGDDYTCGVRTDGTIACWGGGNTPGQGELASVSAGYTHACGVRTDGSVACWGSEARGVTQADFPATP